MTIKDDVVIGELLEEPVIVTSEKVQSTALSIIATEGETAEGALARTIQTYRTIKAMQSFFEEGIDFGDVKDKKPNEKGYKPSLLLPGMEKARGLLGLREEYKDLSVIRDVNPSSPFFFYEVECVLYHIATGAEVARGQGICHTRESSFMRVSARKCPSCEKEAIKRSTFVPDGAPKGTEAGWYCYGKIGGCGAKFSANDPAIVAQEVGNFNDPQLVWDGLNRARKIANKRAFGDAIKRIAMLSSFFTVDIEDDNIYTPMETLKVSEVPETSTGSKQTSPASNQPNQNPASSASSWVTPEAITKLVKWANDNHFGTNANELLKLVGKTDWKAFADGKKACEAIKNAHAQKAQAPQAPATPPTQQKLADAEGSFVTNQITTIGDEKNIRYLEFTANGIKARSYSRNDTAIKMAGVLPADEVDALKTLVFDYEPYNLSRPFKVFYKVANNYNLVTRFEAVEALDTHDTTSEEPPAGLPIADEDGLDAYFPRGAK